VGWRCRLDRVCCCRESADERFASIPSAPPGPSVGSDHRPAQWMQPGSHGLPLLHMPQCNPAGLIVYRLVREGDGGLQQTYCQHAPSGTRTYGCRPNRSTRITKCLTVGTVKQYVRTVGALATIARPTQATESQESKGTEQISNI
jgi:hypothetical protein